MTYEQAIKVLETLKPALAIFGLHEAINIAIKALEKQIPKKPVQWNRIVRTCPICHEPHSSFLGYKYCYNCGQAIDWSDEE